MEVGFLGKHRMLWGFINEEVELNRISILDVAPNILHYLDLPIPHDVDGRVLIEIFRDATNFRVKNYSVSLPLFKKLLTIPADIFHSHVYGRFSFDATTLAAKLRDIRTNKSWWGFLPPSIKTKKTITILGWYGSGNAGDEAMLSAIISCVRNVAPSCMINVLSINPCHKSRTHNVNSVSIYDKSSILRLLFETDLFILGGGGLLKPNSAKRYSRFLFLFKMLGARTMTYGIAAIPLLSPVERLTTQLALRFCDAITVRDTESKEVLKAMGINKPIYTTADPVFSLTVDAEPSLESLKRVQKPYVAMCLRHWQNEDLIHSGVHRFIHFDRFITMMAELCDVLVERGFEVVLIPMFAGERESDVDDHKALADRSKYKDHIHVIENQLSTMKIIELLRFAEVTIGMRLHSLMFSVLATTPIVALSYAMKVKGFMKSIGLERYCIDLRHLDERGLHEAVFSAYKCKDMLRERLKKVVAFQRRKTRMNEKIVASLL